MVNKKGQLIMSRIVVRVLYLIVWELGRDQNRIYGKGKLIRSEKHSLVEDILEIKIPIKLERNPYMGYS